MLDAAIVSIFSLSLSLSLSLLSIFASWGCWVDVNKNVEQAFLFFFQ